MKPRHKRFVLVLTSLIFVSIAVALLLKVFQSNLVYFFTPTEISEGKIEEGRNLRLGGLVVEGSVKRLPGTLTVHFSITDTNASVPVIYSGILPDLFRETKGVVVEGVLGLDGVIKAERVLAKHDENYMPPEAIEAIKNAADLKDAMNESVVNKNDR